MLQERQKSCKERVREHYRGRVENMATLWRLYCKDPEASDPELGCWMEYGLGFDYVVIPDYVAPRTFGRQPRGYWRFQLSWGGPSDEFRFYCDENYQPTKIEYWFLDWYDGAKVSVTGKARGLLDEIWQDWRDCELPQEAKRKAEE